MAYIYGNRTQITFLPEAIENYVTEVDPVRVYDAFIDAIPKKTLGLTLNETEVGSPSYDPITMIKILVYGYSYGWRSSRKIERALYHNLSFMWLSGGLKPDHKTISKFRRDNKEALKNVIKQCARMCVKLGLIDGNTLFVDGSKFRANAGNSQTKGKATWEKYRSHIEQRIDELLEECQKVDEDDEDKESLVKVQQELKSKEKLKAKIDRLFEEINEGDKINGTDPDSQFMKGRQGSHVGYNSQIVSDEAHGLIASTDVVTSNNDLNQLQEQIHQAEATLGSPVKNVCADAGYSSVNDIKPLLDEGKTVIVPSNKQAQKKPRENQFGKEAFTYHPTSDTYTCPTGEELYRCQYLKKQNRIEYRMKKSSACNGCIYFGQCTSSSMGRRLYRLLYEEAKEKLEKTYESVRGQQIYAKRKMRVEHPIGHIKRNLGAGTFLLRGLEGVKAELSILATCFNIARMITIKGGVYPLLRLLKEYG